MRTPEPEAAYQPGPQTSTESPTYEARNTAPPDPGARSPAAEAARPPDDTGPAAAPDHAPEGSSPYASEIPPPGDPAYDAPGPEGIVPPAAAERAPSSGEGAELTPDEMAGQPARRPAPPPSSALPPLMGADERAPSFGDGAELSSRIDDQAAAVPDDRAPSFGDGAELGPPNATTRPDAGVPPGSSPPPGQPYPPGASPYRRGPGPTTPPPVSPSGPLLLPLPPPVRSDALTRSVYQLQTEVYGIQAAMVGRPILPRLVIRIESLRRMGLDLVELSVGRPRLRLMAVQVNSELENLHAAAVSRDRVTMDRSLAIIVDLLTRMRMPGPP